MRLKPIFATAALLVLASTAQAQTLRIALASDIDTMDPSFSRSFAGTIVMTGLCDKLVDMDEKLNIVPVLAPHVDGITS